MLAELARKAAPGALTCRLSIPASTFRKPSWTPPDAVESATRSCLWAHYPPLSPAEQDEVYGARMYSWDLAAYNRMRKVEPLTWRPWTRVAVEAGYRAPGGLGTPRECPGLELGPDGAVEDLADYYLGLSRY